MRVDVQPHTVSSIHNIVVDKEKLDQVQSCGATAGGIVSLDAMMDTHQSFWEEIGVTKIAAG
jgi:hypothetical protein